MKVIGLTGGIATGKSTVAAIFSLHGVPVFNADAYVHQQLKQGGKAVPAIETVFPQTVINGAIDRTMLGEIVFADEKKLKRLEEIMHPLVREAEIAFIGEHKAAGKKLVVLEVPLLYETGMDSLCDITIVTDCPAAIQKERALSRPHMTPAKLEHILRQQMSAEEKRRRANHVIRTDLPLEEMEGDVRRLVKELKS